MTFKEFVKNYKNRDAVNADAFKPEFINFLHFENEIKNRDGNANKRLFFYFNGTIKELKTKLLIN